MKSKVSELVGNFKSSLQRKITVEKNLLGVVAQKLEQLKKKSDSTFSSTNYMMLLLAFSFGITVALRAFSKECPIITDQTLVEYGGMSFLILAIIILASGGKIESDTVGPLLGTVAGYIFGRSIGSRSGSNS